MIKDIIDTFEIGASYIIGSYILPGEPLNRISKTVGRKIRLNITSCDTIIEKVEKREFDLGLIENPIFKKGIIYKEWIEDELVICSKNKLPNILNIDDLKNLKLITRDKTSPTRKTISNFFKNAGISYSNFNSTIKADNPTALIQGVKWSRPNTTTPTVSIVSKIAIEDEVKSQKLYISRIKNLIMKRKFYILYRDRELSKVANVL